MLIELEVERARLAFNASIAAILRKQFGLERAPRGGYRALPRIRTSRMETSVRVPRGVVTIHLLRLSKDGATAVIEFEDKGRIRQAEIPRIALQRFARRQEALKR